MLLKKYLSQACSQEFSVKPKSGIDRGFTKKTVNITFSAAVSAAKKGLIPLVKQYVDNGGNINCTDDVGRTLLHHACAGGHVDMVRYLLEETNIDTNLYSNEGLKGMDFAFQEWHIDLIQFFTQWRAAKSMECGAFRQEIYHDALLRSFTTKVSACVEADPNLLFFIPFNTFLDFPRLPSFNECEEEQFLTSFSEVDAKANILYISYEPGNTKQLLLQAKCFSDELASLRTGVVDYVWVEHACIPTVDRLMRTQKSQMAVLMALLRSRWCLILPSPQKGACKSGSKMQAIDELDDEDTVSSNNQTLDPEPPPSPSQNSMGEIICTALSEHLDLARSQLEVLVCSVSQCSMWCYFSIVGMTDRFIHIPCDDWFSVAGAQMFGMCSKDLKPMGAANYVHDMWCGENTHREHYDKLFITAVETLFLLRADPIIFAKILTMTTTSEDLLEQQYSMSSMECFTLFGVFNSLGKQSHKKESLLGILNAYFLFLAFATDTVRSPNLKYHHKMNEKSVCCCLM